MFMQPKKNGTVRFSTDFRELTPPHETHLSFFIHQKVKYKYKYTSFTTLGGAVLLSRKTKYIQ